MPGLSLEILADSGTTIGGSNLGVATQRAQPDIYYINPWSLRGLASLASSGQ